MKRTILWLMFGLIASASFAQIEIGNYRMNEMKNWNDNIVISNQQLNQFKAQIRNNREMVLSVDVMMNIEATSYTVVFNVRQVAETALEVNQLFNSRLNALKSNLEKYKLINSDLVVEVISQVPIYGLKSQKKLFSTSHHEVPIGFELHKNVSISFTDYNLLNDIVFEASKSEIYDMVKVDYFAKNPMLYYDTMRHAAGQYIKAIEKSYKEAGYRIDTFERVMAEQTGAVYPITRYTQYKPLSKLSYTKLLKKGEGTIVPTVKATPSMYYNPLPFHDFDLILHADIQKPSIQYTMNIQAKFMQPVKVNPTVKIEKQFFMITDDGQVKLINVAK